MPTFEPGKIIKTDFGTPIEIGKLLGSGGQGDVYMVTYNGKKKALKWYKNAGTDPKAFYENLKSNVKRGAPSKEFLWPEAVTEWIDDSFGYIMDLRPEGYYEPSEYMLANVAFSSFKAVAEACIKITSAFRILHNIGFSYQDLNDGNFFIHPQTGDVLICDNDNVAPNGTHMGVIGKPRYMAPEIVVGKGKKMPDSKTDRFSLAVILFLLLCMNHPLEGKKYLSHPCITPPMAEKVYGSEALFICDLNDKSNAPVKDIHTNVIARWKYMPSYIKEAFVEAFSQQSIKDPARRLKELAWLKVLVRFRSDIVRCPCGNEVFVINAATTPCDHCGKSITIGHVIKFPEYSMTAVKGSRIYRCQLGYCNDEEALMPVALVVAKEGNNQELGLKNMTPLKLKAFTPSGKARLVQPQEVIPFRSGIILEAYDGKIELI